MAKPEIRLKGFEGEWKETPLGDISTSFSGGTPLAGVAEYYGGNIPFIRSGEIAEDKTQLFITKEGLESSSARIVEKGTLLYALYGATSGEVSISKINGAINQAILAIYPMKGYSSKYLSHYLRAKKDKIVGTLLQGGQGNLSGKLVKSIRIILPETYKEQNAIADFFNSIDSLINSSTKKIESLKQMKSACLVSMFPQADETTPRVRFKGFEGEWDRKPLSDCLEISNEKNFDDKYGKESVLSVSDDFGVMNQIELLGRSYAGKSVNNYGILRHGELVYTKSPLKSKPYGIVKENTGETGIVSVLYAIYRAKEGCWIPYFHYYFDPAWRLNAYLRPLINKGAKNTMNISDETALTGYIMVPKDIKEQQCIASYFRSLDKQISLQEQKLEKLKQIKAACLDKMFV